MRAIRLMRLAATLLLAASAAFICGVAAQEGEDPFWHLHDACFKGPPRDAAGSHVRWNVHVDFNATTISKYDVPHWIEEDTGAVRKSESLTDSMTHPVLVIPSGTSSWPAGVAFAAHLQQQGFFPTTAAVVDATWSKTAQQSRIDTMTFKTDAGVDIVFTSTHCATQWDNCDYHQRKHCYSAWNDQREICCGDQHAYATCMPTTQGLTCCRRHDVMSVCQPGQTCCIGHQSHGVKCCDAGATCCGNDSPFSVHTCCPAGTTCCGQDVCCSSGQVCNSARQCVPAATNAPTLPPPTTVAPGVHRACFTHTPASGAAVYYDVTSRSSSGTTLQRWRNGALLDSNWYAAFHLPAAGTTAWDEGVGYAATMQTRNAWINNEPIQAATWEVVGGENVWRFSTFSNGSPLQLVFRTSNCVEMTTAPATSTPPTTAAPATLDPNRARRACLTYTTAGTVYYDVRVNPSTGTTLERRSNGAVMDVNWYAVLHTPAAGTITWDEGVAYAATMQTRNAWVNNEPTQAATWEVVNGEDVWRFSTTINGSPLQLVFRSSNCVN